VACGALDRCAQRFAIIPTVECTARQRRGLEARMELDASHSPAHPPLPRWDVAMAGCGRQMHPPPPPSIQCTHRPLCASFAAKHREEEENGKRAGREWKAPRGCAS